MIPKTPAECDAFIANVSAAILAAMSVEAYARSPWLNNATRDFDAGQQIDKPLRMRRAMFAVQEAETLLAELQLHAKVQRLDDGFPLAESATDPAKRFCAHGVSFADECKQCAESGTAPPTSGTDQSNTAAIDAFHAGLRTGP